MVLESNTLDVLFVKDGQQGEDGKVLYTWIKYAKDANGTGMTDDPNGAIYIGISYNNESSIESNDPTQYAWTKIQGADGKKGEDAYTIFLENENISFATDENRNPLSEQAYTSGITIMKGAKPVTDFTIGDIAKTQGIAVAKTDTAIAISVVNGNPLPNDSGEIEIPVTVGGTVFKKILTWTCAKKGEQGEKGEQGIQGPQGEQGIAGKDGTSVTITNKSITYQLSTSGTTIPTGTWQTTPQAIPEGQYQWTKTFVTYSDGNKTESYSISYHGKNGSDGTSVKTTSTSVKYQVGDSGTTKPTGTWQSNVPTVAQGKYLWTQTIVNYSDGNSTESYSVSYKGIDGSNGVNGMNAATIYLYQRATSTPSKPSNTLTYTFSTTKISGTLNNGWSTAIPTGTDAVYVTVASVSSKNDTATIATSAWSAPVVLAQNGKTGSDGKAGLNVATIYLYQRNTSKPSKPSASVTYTFSTGVASGLNNGWSQKIPDGTNPLYVTLATASSNTATDTILSSEWSDVVVMAQNGEDGQDGISPKVSLSKSGNTTTISIVDATGTHTQTVKDGTNGTPGEAGKDGKTSYFHVKYSNDGGKTFTGNSGEDTGIYMGSYTDYTEGDSTDVSKYTWVRVKGEDGAGFHWNLVKGTDTPKEFQPYSGVNVGRTFYEIDFRDKTINSDDKFAISFDFEWTQFTQNNNGTFDWWFQGAVNKGWDEGNPFTYIVGQVIKKNMSKITDGAGSYHVECYASGIESKLYDFGVRFDNSDGTGKVKISNFKLEEGDKPSPWCTTYEETLAKNLSITPSSQYFKSTDGGKTFVPDTITIKPTIQGEINFGKWQYSIDGGVSFADVVSGQKGLTISNNVLTVGKDSSLYSDAVTMVTFRAVANDSSFYDTCSIAKIYDVSDIGDGRNLWITRDNITLQACEKDKYIYTTTGTSVVCIGATGSSVGTNTIALQTGTKYTISFVISSPSEVGNAQWYFCTALNSTGVKNYGGYGVKLVTGENIVSQTITVDTSCDTAGLVLYNLPTGCVIKDIQVEKGSSPTGWSPAPEDVQTAILSTKSEISDVSLKVDKNKQAIEQRVEKTTYQQDLNLVKGDISKANEGLNKWRYEIYPKSLFASEYQGKSTMDVFAKNTNLTPSQSVLINDTDFGKSWAYGDNYIGYALTFVKFSAAKSVAITFKHDDGAHLYLNGKLIGGDDTCNTSSGESLTLSFIQGWNCLEVVLNEKSGGEYIGLGTTISALSECQLMNCYYGTPVARQSHITNQLVENMTNINGISTKVSKVMSVIGEDGKNFTDFKNDYSDFKQTMNGFKTTVGQTYVTKDDFNGLEIGGRNLLLYSQTIRAHNNYYGVSYLIDEVETFNGCPVWSVKDQWGKLAWSFKSHVIDRGLVKVGDTLTYSLYAKTNNASGKSISCSYRFKGNAQAYWFKGSAFNIGTSWARYSATFTVTKDMLATDTYMNEIGFEETVSMSGDDKVYFACPKLERGTKATDYTEAPEDDKINGQNLVSNLPSNWEQGTVSESSAVGTTYANTKSSNADTIRPKELIPVHGDITISAAYSNQSKKPIRHWIAAYDINKNYLGQDYVLCAWNDFPQTLNMKDAKYIAIMVGYTDGSPIAPSDISQICLKIERGTSATPFTLAPEDVNGKIVNVETIANQTANKFEWIVKSGDSSSNFTLTDRVADLVAERINFKGLVTFSGLSTDAKNEIGKVAQSKVDGLEVGGRNLLVQKNITEGYLSTDGKGSFIGSGGGDQTSDWIDVSGNKYITVTLYEDFTNTNNSGRYCEYDADKNCINTVVYNPRQKSSIIIELKSNTKYIRVTAIECKTRRYKIEAGNKATDWTPAPEDVSQDATNKASQALTDAENYSSNAVNWVASNGSSTTSLNSMVKKWTDGAVSDTTQINGGWIKANTITASKIAVGDFTNYCQLDKDTASSYGFTATDDTKGVWFTASPIDRDKHISQWFTCEGGQKLYVEYDLSTTVKGKVEASDTDISYLTSGIMIYAANGAKQIVSYMRSKGVTATSDGAITHVSLVETLPADTRFFKVVLQTNGQGNTFSGTLKIRNPQVRKATTGKLIVDGSITADKIAANAITADKIATDAIKSHNYISSGGTQGSFLNLGDGSFTSPNLSWDSNGNLIAKNANLSGEITATKGTVGGWNIDNYSIYTTYDANQNIFGAGISGTKGKYVLWAGETNDAIGANRSSDAPTDASLVIYNNGGLEVRKSMVGNDKKNHLYTTILQSGQINLKMDDDYIGTITATDTISSNSTVTMRHVSMAAKNGYGWSILHTNESGSLISDIQRDPSDTKIKINSPITVSSTDISKYNAIETTGDVVVSGKIHANYGSNKIQLNPDNNGSIELYGYTPFIDFHYGNSDSDYTSRIIAQEWGLQIVGTATVTGDLYCDAHIYTCTNGHFSWAGQTDAYLGCGNYSGGNNIYYYANYHAFYVNNDSGSGMMYINTNGVTSRVGFTKTSDERIKKNFESFDDNIIDAYMNIEPVKYQLKQSSNDNYHFGFKAQHVDKVFSDYGDIYNESFDICTSRPIDPDKAKELYGVDDMTEEYGLRYDELIAPTTYMVQHIYKELESTKGELAKVKQEKADLETRLQAIEAKLGL